MLSNLQISEQPRGVSISCDVFSEVMPSKIEVSVTGVNENEIGPLNYDWAAVAALIPAMFLGQNLIIKGSISRELKRALTSDLQDVLKIYEPEYKRITVECDSVYDPESTRNNRVATGFSAGVDSFATVCLYSGQEFDPVIPLTDLCTFNVGAMGEDDTVEVQKIFKSYCDRSDQFAERNGLNSISVDTSIASLYQCGGPNNPLLNFQKTHSFRNAAAALTLTNRLDYYLYSSAYGLDGIKIATADDPACMDPIILPLLSSKRTTIISSGAGLSRFEKTKLLTCSVDAQRMLDVCANSAEVRLGSRYINCSKCWKCNRTMISLEVLGKLDEFRGVFDIDYYEENKRAAYNQLIISSAGGNKLDMEVLQQARAKNLQIGSSFKSVIGSAAIRTKKSMKKNANLLRMVRRMRKAVQAK